MIDYTIMANCLYVSTYQTAGGVLQRLDLIPLDKVSLITLNGSKIYLNIEGVASPYVIDCGSGESNTGGGIPVEIQEFFTKLAQLFMRYKDPSYMRNIHVTSPN